MCTKRAAEPRQKSKFRSHQTLVTTKTQVPTMPTRTDITYTPAAVSIGQWTSHGRSVDKLDVSEFSIFRLRCGMLIPTDTQTTTIIRNSTIKRLTKIVSIIIFGGNIEFEN